MDELMGQGELPRTFVSPTIAALVKQGLTSEEGFWRDCSSTAKEGLEDDCAVCLLPLSKKEAICNSKCRHVLHRECIELLFSTSNKCPHCRVEWYSDKVEAPWADATLEVLSSLEHDGRHMLFIEDMRPHMESMVGELLGASVLMMAHCMQVHDTKQTWLALGDTGDVRHKAKAFYEAALMREAAKSATGYQLVKYLLPVIKRTSQDDLRIFASFVDDPDAMDVNPSAEADGLTAQVMRSLRRNEVDRKYRDAWILAAYLLCYTIKAFKMDFGDGKVSPLLLRFLCRLVIGSLLSFCKGLHLYNATLAVDETEVSMKRDVKIVRKCTDRVREMIKNLLL